MHFSRSREKREAINRRVAQRKEMVIDFLRLEYAVDGEDCGGAFGERFFARC